MGHFVHLEYMVVSEGLAADVTLVGLFTCVCTDVYFELLGACESLLAVFAGVWLFTGVGSHVNHKLSGLNECLTTHLQNQKKTNCIFCLIIKCAILTVGFLKVNLYKLITE